MAYANALLPSLRGDLTVDDLDTEFEKFKAQNAAGPAAGSSASSSAGANGAANTVTVARGDSLSALAGRYYGDEKLWPLLWDANKAVVGPNPNLISPGMVLAIPPLASFTSAQIADARQRHSTWRNYPLAAGR
jgi:nucleoid-associated protein YgaU